MTNEEILAALNALPKAELDAVVESLKPASTEVKLFESALLSEAAPVFQLTEANGQSNFTMKIIRAGKGSSGYYEKAMLQRDGPNVFKAGTHVYVNHATAAEEAARPEGDYNKLAGVLSGNAYWDEGHKAGAGLYAPVKFFSDFAPAVKEKAAYTGASIKAYGELGDKRIEGMQVVKSLTRAESVDLVTRAGAGGAVLTESAKETIMDEAQVKALIESATNPILATVNTLTAENKTLKESNTQLQNIAVKSQARTHISEKVRAEKLPEGAKLRVVDALLASAIPVTEAGALDIAKLDLAIVEAVKTEATYISSIVGNQVVMGMGPHAEAVALKPEELQTRAVEHAKAHTAGAKVSEAALLAYANGRGN